MLLPNKVVSLRHYLSRWILLVVLLMGLSMIAASYFSGLQSIQQSVTVLSQQISSHVAVRLDRFFGGIVSLVQINQQAISSGLLTFDNKEALQQQFMSQVAFVPYVTFISAADIYGEYTGATRTPDTGELQMMTAYLSDEHQMCVYQVDADNQRGALIHRERTFDAPSRSWYQQAVRQQKLSWYPVYKYQPYESMGVGVSAPIFDHKTGLFTGVVTVDLALDRVSSFLRQLVIGAHGVIFLVDDKGRLAASSLDASVYKTEGEQTEQYRLSTYSDARLQAVAEITQPQGQFQVQIDGKDYVLHKQLIQDEHGLYFIVGVLLATADFTADLYSVLFLQLALLFLLVVSALLLLRYLIGFVAKPVEQLQHQVEILAKAKWGGSPVNSGHILELNALAAAVNDMSDSLHSAFLSHERTIAERTAALQEVKYSKEQAEFFAMIAHEIKTPIAMIDGALQSLKILDDSKPEEIEKRKERIDRAVKRLNHLVDRFLQQGKLDSSRFELSAQLLDLSAFCLGLVPQYKGHQTIRCNITEQAMVMADIGLLSLAVGNLLDNAIKYSPADSVIWLAIEILSNETGDWCLISVKDTGRGIDRERVEMLFRPYQRGKNLGDIPGMGLGLYMVNKIARLHQGSLSYHPQPNGQGSVFTLKLPKVLSQ
jgi:signal transduction histidine kinase